MRLVLAAMWVLSGCVGAATSLSDAGLGASATLTLTADTQGVHPQGKAVLSWSATDVTDCTTSWGASGTSGSFTTEALSVDTTYSVSCTSPRDGVVTKQLTIEVGASVDEPGAIGHFSIHHSLDQLEAADTLISLASLNVVPDGGLPRITSEGGHLVAAGTRVRLYGLNMPLASAMVERADAEKIVLNLRKQGFNAVRLIALDALLNTPDTFTVTYRQQGFMNVDGGINDTALDRLDAFVDLAERNGIYLQLVLSQGRAHYGLPCERLNRCRGIDMYLPSLIARQQTYAKALLTHTNPYSQRQYATDPGVVALEINNENGLGFVWQQGSFDDYANSPSDTAAFLDPLAALWRAWVKAKYSTPAATAASWGVPVADFQAVTLVSKATASSVPLAQLKDWYQFLGETEKAYLDQMYAYLKTTLGVTSLVYGAQADYNALWVPEQMDVADIHDYFGLESPAKQDADGGVVHNPGNGRPVQVSDNRTMLQVQKPASEQVIGPNDRKSPTKPNFWTEFAYYNGNQHLAEMDPVVAAYAGFQDLDAIYLFNYHGMNLYSVNNTYPGYYNMTVNALTRWPAAVAFRRGDVQPGERFVVRQTKDAHLTASASVLKNSAGKRATLSVTNFDFGGQARAVFTNNVYSEVIADDAQKQVVAGSCKTDPCVYVTTSGEIRWNPGAGDATRFMVDTPRSKFAVGYFDRTSVALGAGIDVQVGHTLNHAAVVTLTSLDLTPLPSERMLLTVAGHFTEPNEWPRQPGDSDWSWGDDAQVVEAVPALVHVASAGRFQVTALDSTGARAKRVPVVQVAGGFEFVTGPRYDTGWYVIEQVP